MCRSVLAERAAVFRQNLFVLCAISNEQYIHTIGNSVFTKSIRATGMNTVGNMVAFANDPDFTYLRPRGTNASPTSEALSPNRVTSLTEAEWQTGHSFVSLLGGAMFISDPVQEPEYEAHIRAFELLNPPAPERGRSWHAAWNPHESPAAVALDIHGLEALGEQFHVWSFWDEQYLGVHDQNFTTALLPSHGPALLRLTALPPDDTPVLIGSSMHIGMGAAEVSSVETAGECCTIRLHDAGAREGRSMCTVSFSCL